MSQPPQSGAAGIVARDVTQATWVTRITPAQTTRRNSGTRQPGGRIGKHSSSPGEDREAVIQPGGRIGNRLSQTACSEEVP